MRRNLGKIRHQTLRCTQTIYSSSPQKHPENDPACVDRHRPIGVTIRLDAASDCARRDDTVPRVEIWGGWASRPELYCALMPAKSFRTVSGLRLGSLTARACLSAEQSGWKTLLAFAEADGRVIFVRLSTTPERFEHDRAVFAEVLTDISIEAWQPFASVDADILEYLRQMDAVGWTGFHWDQFSYENVSYEFSVILPHGVLPCSGAGVTDHGMHFMLDPADGCNTERKSAPLMGVYADYNASAPDMYDSVADQIVANCVGEQGNIREIEWLRDLNLGSRRARGCRVIGEDGRVRISLSTFRKIKPSDPWSHIHVKAYLVTTTERLGTDYDDFKRMIEGVWIHPDGPYDGHVGFRRP